MQFIFLGTGCPVVSLERFGPAHLVQHQGRSLLVDCGSGVTQRLLAAGCPGRDLDALLLTHLHSDHLIDLYQLIVSSWHQGRDRPQRIFGPPGTLRYVEGLMALWRQELDQRIAHEKRPSTAALEIEAIEISDGWKLQLGELHLEAFAVDHRPVCHAFGFSFQAAGRRLILSGDTRPCANLEAAAQGADLLVNEVFIHRDMPVVPGVRSAETVENVAAYHILSSEVGKLARRANVRCLALTHFVPPHCDRAALLAEVKADFEGPVILGEDLMRLDLANGSLIYNQAHIALPFA